MAVPLRAISFRRAGLADIEPYDSVLLDAQGRHIRRRLLTCRRGDEVLVDFATAVALEHGDALVLEDGRCVQVVAVAEELMEVRGRDPAHLLRLAWHIGNRHLEAQIEDSRILIRNDRVIAPILEQLGASVRPVSEAFAPQHGAYDSHGHSHDH